MELYGLQPAAIDSLAMFENAGRGVYRVEDAQGQVWVLRLAEKTEHAPWQLRPATVLRWLAERNLPAPRLRCTVTGQLVGAHGGWWSCLLTFVEGQVVTPQPAALRLVGAALAQLHVLGEAPGAQAGLPASTWHPAEAVPATRAILPSVAELPVALQPLGRGLAAAVREIEQRSELPFGLVHGDCWHTNAIATEEGGVVLVDWDGAGWGLPVLDLGQLLLASHYDLVQPLKLRPTPDKVAAILEGYTAYRLLADSERQTLVAAMQFGLARRFAAALGEAAGGKGGGDEVVIRKLQLRFEACFKIAVLAEGWLESRRMI